MAKKNSFLSNYVLLQSIFIIMLIVIFMYLRKQMSVLENNPTVVTTAHKQLLLAEEIYESALAIRSETDQSKLANEVGELNMLLKEYPKLKKDLFDYLHKSGIRKDEKKKVSDLFEEADHYINKVYNSAQLLSQKHTNEEKVSQLKDVIMVNKTRFSVSMTKILNIFNQETQLEIVSIRSKEQFLFISSLLLSIFNLIVIMTPMKNKLLGLTLPINTNSKN